MPEGLLEAVLAASHLRTYRRGQMIARSVPEEDTLLVVIEGEVRLYLVSEDGREFTLARHGRGAVLWPEARGPVAGGETAFEATADGTVLWAMPWTRLVNGVCQDRNGAKEMICLMRKRVDEHRAVIGELAFHPVRARLARKLVQLAMADARHMVRLTREELAHTVNTTRQRVSAELARFRERQLIQYESSGNKRWIRVLDLEGLSSIGSACGVSNETDKQNASR